MANVKDNVAAKETKRRLMDAAGAVFAERGFERATIKQITTRAGVSMAAVNYHFSDKNELYYQVIRHAHEMTGGAVDLIKEFPPAMPPPQRLRVFIRALLGDMLNPELPEWHGILLWREMQQPTAPTERLLSETFCACSDGMESLIAALVHRPIPRDQLRLIGESVIGQILFHVLHQEMQTLLYPDVPPAHARIDTLANHIADFSLAAVDSLFNSHHPASTPSARAAV